MARQARLLAAPHALCSSAPLWTIHADYPMTIHFISGLPRSGSTLLSALLRQNPRIHAAMSSPVATLCSALLERMSANNEYSIFLDTQCRKRLLTGVFGAYYHEVGRELVFDTNRSWTGKMALIQDLYPGSRIVCCVREVSWILDSFEHLFNQNPLQISRILNFAPTPSLYTRIDMLMNSETGVIGQSWSTLREAFFGEHSSRLILVPYDRLARAPLEVLAKLYAELDEPQFVHDIENVEYAEHEFDDQLGVPGLHSVRSKVDYKERPTCLPPDVAQKYKDLSFWTKPSLSSRKVTIL